MHYETDKQNLYMNHIRDTIFDFNKITQDLILRYEICHNACATCQQMFTKKCSCKYHRLLWLVALVFVFTILSFKYECLRLSNIKISKIFLPELAKYLNYRILVRLCMQARILFLKLRMIYVMYSRGLCNQIANENWVKMKQNIHRIENFIPFCVHFRYVPTYWTVKYLYRKSYY